MIQKIIFVVVAEMFGSKKNSNKIINRDEEVWSHLSERENFIYHVGVRQIRKSGINVLIKYLELSPKKTKCKQLDFCL